jgi:hypothetical protein
VRWGFEIDQRRRGRPGRMPTWRCLIGSVRRECLDHVIAFGESHLRRIVTNPPLYYPLINLVMRVGESEFLLRLPSVIAGTMAIPLIYVTIETISRTVTQLRKARLHSQPLEVRGRDRLCSPLSFSQVPQTPRSSHVRSRTSRIQANRISPRTRDRELARLARKDRKPSVLSDSGSPLFPDNIISR